MPKIHFPSLLLGFLPILFTGCQNSPNCTHFHGWAMTMPYQVTVGRSLTIEEYKKVSSIIQDTFHEIDATVNNWNPQSEISQFNQSTAGTIHKPSEHLSFLLELSNKIHSLTEKFDPSIAPLALLWQKGIPSPEEIKHVQAFIGWTHIQWKEGFLSKDDDQTQLDFCSLSKGYAVDLLTERLLASGYPDLFIEWAGEIRAHGIHPAKRFWKVEIDPGTTQNRPTLFLENRSIATSGGRHHIFDPATGLSAESNLAVAITAPTCALADALATALMLLPSEIEARALLQNFPEVNSWMFIPLPNN